MPVAHWLTFRSPIRPIHRIALTLMCVVSLVVGLLPAAAAPTPAAIGIGSTYLALGDSLTTGTEAAANNDGKPGYPLYLYDLIKGSSDVELKLLGRDGETSTSMIAAGGQLDQAVAFIAQEHAAGRVVSPVTLTIGGNDMVAVLRGSTDVDGALSLFRTNLGLILDQLDAALTVDGQRTGDLVIMTYYNPYPNIKINPPGLPGFPISFPIDTNRDIQRFNDVILQEAAERANPISIAPVFEAFDGKQSKYVFANPSAFPPSEKTLDYHPTEAGHQTIAATFRQTLGYTVEVKVYLPVVIK